MRAALQAETILMIAQPTAELTDETGRLLNGEGNLLWLQGCRCGRWFPEIYFGINSKFLTEHDGLEFFQTSCRSSVCPEFEES